MSNDNWIIEAQDGDLLTQTRFSTREAAQGHIQKMPRAFHTMYRVHHKSDDPWLDRVLNEGLMKNDLDRILMPRVSIDEYVPADPNTENVVIGFFIKGVPEAVLPFKDFCNKCNGVLDVDYGDSDTILNTSIIYVEMDRENVDMQDVNDLMIQVSMLTSFEISDFTMTFPHTDKKFPFCLDILNRYFVSRSRRKNALAQRKAEKEASKDDKIQPDQTGDQSDDQQNEALAESIAALMFE